MTADTPDPKRHAPATQRNREAILEVLAAVLPPAGTVLEIASGTGEHAVYFAARLSHLLWQPSDPDAPSRASIAAHAAEAGLPNLLAPLDIDTRRFPWVRDGAGALPAAIVAINMVHISPWEATEGLLEGAGLMLPPDGLLYLYGPYRQGGAHTAPSNASFDAWLKERDPRFGVRDLEEVAALARECGLDLAQTVAMPANNLSLIFRRR